MVPMRMRDTQCADCPNLFPKNIRIRKEIKGKNKLSSASRVRLFSISAF